uniref:Alcohol dehydrogenase-like N-terminal domain-containing protein n=1 Tax=Glycine max TaxID=3847 RepID=A0A0R0ITF2_SOYBN
MAVPPEMEHPRKAFGWTARDTSGVLSPFKFSRRETGEKDVAFKVLYCAICHSDLHMLKNEWGISTYPLVPGHEIAGEVTEVGSKVRNFKVGDKVGVGCMVLSCRSCQSCEDNLENYCPKMIVTYSGKLPLDAAAPLLCAGITVYSPLRYFAIDKQGMQLGVVGLGDLDHMAVKFAKAFGAKAAMGTLDGIIDTVSAIHPLPPLLGMLKSQGKLVMVGLPEKPLELPIFPLLADNSWVIGGIKETQEMIDFVTKHDVKPDIEIIPIDYVNTALECLLKAYVKYRFLIDIGNTLKPIS